MKKIVKRIIGAIDMTEDEDIEQDDVETIVELFGSKPIEHYFLASPGYYGYGGYGSDWCADFWVLEDGRGATTSGYTGEEEFDSDDKMFNRMYEIQDEFIVEVDKMYNEGDLDEDEYSELMSYYG